MNSAPIITSTEKYTLFYISRAQTNDTLLHALNSNYDFYAFQDIDSIDARIKLSQPDLIMIHSEEFDFSMHRFNHIPKIWLTSKTDVTEDEVVRCYEKGIVRVSFQEDKLSVIPAKINGIITSHQQREYHIKKQLLLGESSPQGKIKEKELIEQIYNYLAINSSNEEFSIERMSKDLAMSRTNFFSKVKAIIGVSPSKMVMNYRLANAAIMLKETNQNIAEIAYKVGFSSTAYFTKCFKEKYGKKPSEIRKI